MNSYRICPRHLERMTDDTGLLEHALGSAPRRQEGYTTDDNARALWACSVIQRMDPDASERWLKLADIYLAFLLWLQKEDGTFHNNVAYDRSPEPEMASDDCHGRAVWAAVNAWAELPDEGSRWAAETILLRSAAAAQQLQFPRGWAYTLAAYSRLWTVEECYPLQMTRPELLEKLQVWTLIERLEGNLMDLYSTSAEPGWHWFEPQMTYGNGVLPWALYSSYQATGRETVRRVAKESLDFLAEQMTAKEGWIRPIGNRGWADRGHRSRWDQQPLEVMKLALAAREAYRVEGSQEYKELIRRCREWFHGENDCRRPLADPSDGSCCDGLTPNGPNRNKGAESTISFLLTEYMYAELHCGRDELEKRAEMLNI
ncbi:glycosyl transferase [Paenibacillus cineris]|uniref:Glycosyl transferase n=1 Tax=Paenibacillus cineris TaxID=237530 RepID=A0ABQ4LBT1_9BACL|nr:glycosyl transferase [Paenibacillus cineris]GIO53875.1 glycosyl transferase [Paenibacillus cineris]